MNQTTYSLPVGKLLTLGEANYDGRDWLDYRRLGIGAEHVPDLLRMLTDETLILIGDERAPELWAIVHAARALGQLRAEEAIEPLLTLLARLSRDDLDEWTMEDYPPVFGLIGPAAIPALVAYMNDPAHSIYSRSTVADCLAKIGQNYPESRAECVAAITAQLARFTENAPELNASWISSLLDLRAIEALPLFEQAFEGGYVEETLVNWYDVQDALVLFGYRDDLLAYWDKRWEDSSLVGDLNVQAWKRPWPHISRTSLASARVTSRQEPPPGKARSKAQAQVQKKAKRKQAEKSRKMNRRKK